MIYTCILHYFLWQDPTKAKRFLPFLQRAGKTVALVEVRIYHYYIPACVLIYWGAGVSQPSSTAGTKFL